MRLIIIILLGLGICFRLVNLDHKIYWYDETFTSLRSSGYTEAEIVEHFSHTSIVPIQDLQQYQQPNLQRGLRETLHSLATEDPQHPPLYYALSSYWIRWVGHSVAAMRLLPALLSLLVFPSVYWLCWEWFAVDSAAIAAIKAVKPGSYVKTHISGEFSHNLYPDQSFICYKAAVGWIAIGLLAVSPFHVLYAQEAREYSLWSATALLATAAFLRAMRVQTTISWLVYALCLASSLYTFLFSIWIILAHAVYLLATSKFRLGSIASYLCATLLAMAAFSPWMGVTIQNLNQIQTVTDWTTNNRSLLSLSMSWASMVGRLFYDRGTGAIDRTVQVSFILLVGVAFYNLCRYAAKSICLLPVVLTMVPALALILPDLIWGGGRSTSPRYLIPALCGIHLAVAYLLATKTMALPSLQGAAGMAIRQRWRWITAAVFTAGILSNLTIAHAQIWWIKPHNQENQAIAQVINQAAHPLVISDAETADLLSLSYLLDANTDLLVRPRCYTCPLYSPKAITPSILEIPPNYDNVFLFHPRATKEWKQSLDRLQNYRLKSAVAELPNTLWQLVKGN